MDLPITIKRGVLLSRAKPLYKSSSRAAETLLDISGRSVHGPPFRRSSGDVARELIDPRPGAPHGR